MGQKKIFFLFFSFCAISYSQNAIISGIVEELVDSTKVIDASIVIKGTQLEQRTDKNGEFIFDEDISIGEQILRISKPGYEPREVSMFVVEGKKLVFEPIGLLITNDERKKRNKERKQWGEEKIKKKNIQESASFLGKIPVVGGIGGEMPIIKGIFKKKKEEDKATYNYEDIPKEVVQEEVKPIEEKITYSTIQLKYAKLLGVTPDKITNLNLYNFIDQWMGTKYKMAGNGNNAETGIDCSSFTLRLFSEVYGKPNIGRTALQQFIENRIRFKNPEYAQEGDLIFFIPPGPLSDDINHVGVMLTNNKFINSTSRKGPSGVSGVKISDLNDTYWQRRLRSFVRIK